MTVTPHTTPDAWPFGVLERGTYGVILADPPWRFETWSARGRGRSPKCSTMPIDEIVALPAAELAAPDCALFLWAVWPTMPAAFRVIEAWGFRFKTCAFCWLKADPDRCPIRPSIGLGYWTRANSEVCLLATRGTPKAHRAPRRRPICRTVRAIARTGVGCLGQRDRQVRYGQRRAASGADAVIANI
jgi:N6-adenosine-specific RNA methylase IME4